MHATTHTTLTDRYVDAAMRTVPEQQREDLAAELRTSIDDQIEARVEQGETPVEAEYAVLTELGDPDRLAAQYTDRPLWLIGPRYYLTWWRLTKLLWAIVPACAAVGVALAQTLSGANFGEIVGSVCAVTLSVAVHIGFWTTLVFVIVERSSRDETGVVGRWTPADLPELRERGSGLTDLISSLVFLAIAAGAILWDRFVGVAYSAETGWLTFLNPDLWPWWIGALFVLMVLEALLAISVYAKGRWDAGTATVNLVLNVVVAGGALYLLAQQQLINPVFFATILPEESVHTVTTIVNLVFGFGIVAVAAWDSVDAFLKVARARR